MVKDLLATQDGLEREGLLIALDLEDQIHHRLQARDLLEQGAR